MIWLTAALVVNLVVLAGFVMNNWYQTRHKMTQDQGLTKVSADVARQALCDAGGNAGGALYSHEGCDGSGNGKGDRTWRMMCWSRQRRCFGRGIIY